MYLSLTPSTICLYFLSAHPQYEADSAPAIAIKATIDRTEKRFANYAKAGLLCGADGLPHLISDPGLALKYGHAGEVFVSTTAPLCFARLVCSFVRAAHRVLSCLHVWESCAVQPAGADKQQQWQQLQQGHSCAVRQQQLQGRSSYDHWSSYMIKSAWQHMHTSIFIRISRCMINSIIQRWHSSSMLVFASQQLAAAGACS
jgi:hypothetical protein